MNIIAKELNAVLEKTIVFSLFSDLGKEFYFPKGIVAQSAEATANAHKFDATIGMARQKKVAMSLPVIRNLIPELDPNDIFSYAPTPGVQELRKLWQNEILKKNPDLKGKTFSMPLVTAGITSGLGIIAELFTNPGDTVIIPDMFWDNYPLIFDTKRGAVIETFPFYKDGGFNLDGLREVLKNQKSEKISLLLNFPNNPTGYSPSSKEAEGIKNILLETARSGKKILVICDDSYFGLFFEQDIYPQSLFAELADLHENILAVKLDGATKEDFVWGFRVAFISYGAKGLNDSHYEALIKKTMGMIRATISNCTKVGQSLLVRALKSPSYDQQKKENCDIVRSKYMKAKAAIVKKGFNKKISALPFNSGYFMCIKLNGIDSEVLRKYLLSERGIGTIAIPPNYLRIAYASVDENDMEALFDEIFEAVEKV